MNMANHNGQNTTMRGGGAVSALSMQREKIAREIRDLERQKAQIQAEIEEKKMIGGGGGGGGASMGQCGGSGGMAGRNVLGRGKKLVWSDTVTSHRHISTNLVEFFVSS